MGRTVIRLALLSCVIGLGGFSSPAGHSPTQTISPPEAKNRIGERATVCGMVASTKYASSSRKQPTFLNLDKPYPNQIFTVVIWGSDRPKFGQPEVAYRGKSICVTGTVKEYRGVPEIVATAPTQIKIQSEGEK